MPCYSWPEFGEDFLAEYTRLFDAPPTPLARRNARRDWNAGNTGWEAARNAQARARDRVRRAEHKAWADAHAFVTTASRKTIREIDK